MIAKLVTKWGIHLQVEEKSEADKLYGQLFFNISRVYTVCEGSFSASRFTAGLCWLGNGSTLTGVIEAQ